MACKLGRHAHFRAGRGETRPQTSGPPSAGLLRSRCAPLAAGACVGRAGGSALPGGPAQERRASLLWAAALALLLLWRPALVRPSSHRAALHAGSPGAVTAPCPLPEGRSGPDGSWRGAAPAAPTAGLRRCRRVSTPGPGRSPTARPGSPPRPRVCPPAGLARAPRPRPLALCVLPVGLRCFRETAAPRYLTSVSKASVRLKRKRTEEKKDAYGTGGLCQRGKERETETYKGPGPQSNEVSCPASYTVTFGKHPPSAPQTWCHCSKED
ncbi:uncharacterized protein LOC121492937 isoform X2 [Vulpes lagopus]|uniref:uncharacterized protein LOC121492937 isoform X2 n=1 Tax=Vulpes lagopus TaxID=494514 RepID=UPI001BC93487|nr:uncharacterized protein LOC121492937 isoform X2 [Vulpes lagopus]